MKPLTISQSFHNSTCTAKTKEYILKRLKENRVESNNKIVKPGQRKFLLTMGISKESINQMSAKKARNIIAEEEKRRANEREKERYKAFCNEMSFINCIICGCRIELHQYELEDLSKQICESCRDTILTMKDQLRKK